MFYYKAVISYDGTQYCGFQWQKDIPTVQDTINQAIATLVSVKFSTLGASRTDTGVHARHQVVKITLSEYWKPSLLLHQLNQVLPSDIILRSLEECDGSFKVAADHRTKEYRYFFTNEKFLSPDKLRFCSNFSRPLDFQSIQTCLEKIKGVHDFATFSSQGSNVKSSVREIFACDLSIVNPHELFSESQLFNFPSDLRHCYQLRFVGNGFLKQMIRHLVSSLWLVGSGKLSTQDFEMLLMQGRVPNAKRLWRVAPANGLFLYEISYK